MFLFIGYSLVDLPIWEVLECISMNDLMLCLWYKHFRPFGQHCSYFILNTHKKTWLNSLWFYPLYILWIFPLDQSKCKFRDKNPMNLISKITQEQATRKRGSVSNWAHVRHKCMVGLCKQWRHRRKKVQQSWSTHTDTTRKEKKKTQKNYIFISEHKFIYICRWMRSYAQF